MKWATEGLAKDGHVFVEASPPGIVGDGTTWFETPTTVHIATFCR